MAASHLRALAGDSIDVHSASSQPGNTVNLAAVTVMAEEGIDLSTVTPQTFTTDAVRQADVVITMGRGDACPIFPESDTRTGSSPTSPASPSRSCARSATTSRPRAATHRKPELKARCTAGQRNSVTGKSTCTSRPSTWEKAATVPT